MVEMIASAHLIDALLHDVVTKSQGLVGLGVADTLYYIWKWKSWCYVAVVERTNCRTQPTSSIWDYREARDRFPYTAALVISQGIVRSVLAQSPRIMVAILGCYRA